MNRPSLTITYIVKAFPCNYDEGYGNVSIAKKVHRGSGETYLFTSRQALRYSIVNWLVEHNIWKYAQLTPAEGVIQYNPDQLRKEFPEEADLFGYMITAGKGQQAQTRAAVAKLTHLISLEPWYGDQELLTNKNFADRLKRNPDMANIETGYNYYKYTLSVDLDRVGEDENFNHHLTKEEKIKRVCDLIEATKFLFRDIRGKRESLIPLFIIGGVYHIKSPFFHNAVNIEFKGSKPYIKWEGIKQVLETEYKIDEKNKIKIENFTFKGIQKGEFGDDLGINESPFETLDKIKEEVVKAYNEQ
ncbi:MAG: type I-B CRISPR-associated protein Cas7/Cst2/DevR [candidate division WOR-3 bacterium]